VLTDYACASLQEPFARNEEPWRLSSEEKREWSPFYLMNIDEFINQDIPRQPKSNPESDSPPLSNFPPHLPPDASLLDCLLSARNLEAIHFAEPVLEAYSAQGYRSIVVGGCRVPLQAFLLYEGIERARGTQASYKECLEWLKMTDAVYGGRDLEVRAAVEQVRAYLREMEWDGDLGGLGVDPSVEEVMNIVLSTQYASRLLASALHIHMLITCSFLPGKNEWASDQIVDSDSAITSRQPSLTPSYILSASAMQALVTTPLKASPNPSERVRPIPELYWFRALQKFLSESLDEHGSFDPALVLFIPFCLVNDNGQAYHWVFAALHLAKREWRWGNSAPSVSIEARYKRARKRLLTELMSSDDSSPSLRNALARSVDLEIPSLPPFDIEIQIDGNICGFAVSHTIRSYLLNTTPFQASRAHYFRLLSFIALASTHLACKSPPTAATLAALLPANSTSSSSSTLPDLIPIYKSLPTRIIPPSSDQRIDLDRTSRVPAVIFDRDARNRAPVVLAEAQANLGTIGHVGGMRSLDGEQMEKPVDEMGDETEATEKRITTTTTPILAPPAASRPAKPIGSHSAPSRSTSSSIISPLPCPLPIKTLSQGHVRAKLDPYQASNILRALEITSQPDSDDRESDMATSGWMSGAIGTFFDDRVQSVIFVYETEERARMECDKREFPPSSSHHKETRTYSAPCFVGKFLEQRFHAAGMTPSNAQLLSIGDFARRHQLGHLRSAISDLNYLNPSLLHVDYFPSSQPSESRSRPSIPHHLNHTPSESPSPLPSPPISSISTTLKRPSLYPTIETDCVAWFGEERALALYEEARTKRGKPKLLADFDWVVRVGMRWSSASAERLKPKNLSKFINAQAPPTMRDVVAALRRVGYQKGQRVAVLPALAITGFRAEHVSLNSLLL
jgi:hypothetical protein